MDAIDDLKRKLQDLFGDGLVTIVGSGLSCAEGLPGMGALADRLKVAVPALIVGEDLEVWAKVATQLDSGNGLETALHVVSVSAELEAVIVQVTAEYFLEEEGNILNGCMNAGRVMRFSRLLPHLSPSNPKRAEVVTRTYLKITC